MSQKLIIVADPGIDTTFAIALAMHDPNIELIGLLPCAGNVDATQATQNIQILIDQLDPVRWPRTATAFAVSYEFNGTALHGPDGLGGTHFPARTRHQHQPADKVLAEMIHEHAQEICVVCLGPLTTLARALDRDPEIAGLIRKLVVVGGTWKEPGNASPTAEFHFSLDPDAAQRVFRANMNPHVIPLDVTRKLILSPSELLELPNPDSKTCQFLRKIIPYGIRASSNLYGIEGFHLKDVLGVATIALAGSMTYEPRPVNIETRGEFTRGMMVVDARKQTQELNNAQIATDLALGEIRQYIDRVLKQAP